MSHAFREPPAAPSHPARLGLVTVLCAVGAGGWPGPVMTRSAPELDAPLAAPSLAEMRRQVVAASRPATPWAGPRSGPAGRPGRTIAIVAEELRNGGILGVAQGVHEAAEVMRWNVKIFDAGGTAAGRGEAAARALGSGPDGLILIGADAEEMRSRLAGFVERGIPIVGWHVGPRPGPMAGNPVVVNVSTDPLEVARVTAMAAVVASEGRAGVVIFTDSNFRIAMAKAEAMAAVVRACAGCTLLEVRDVAISRCADQMPAVTRELLARHGARWTHALAINDVYFDFAVPELSKAGRPGRSVSLLSAGDGSASAFLRLRARILQEGTVAEPLNLHGWQLVDELNRMLERQPVNGHVVPVHLATPDNVAFDGGPRLQYDPDNGYRDAYRRIWKPSKGG